MKEMATILTSNVEFTGLLLGTFSTILSLLSLIGLAWIIVDETRKFRAKQREEKTKLNLKR